MLSYSIEIEGKVQNVGFRYFTFELAKKLSIKGNVRNLQNGSVMIEAEGENENIFEFISFVKIGPSSSRVTKFYINEIPFQNFTDFSIIR